jgi:hypothetical protein
MNTQTDLDAIRRTAIQRVARTDAFFRMALLAAALLEAGGLAGILLLADFKDRLHQLILAQTLLVYGTLAMGLVAVGALVRLGTLRVLSALEPSPPTD